MANSINDNFDPRAPKPLDDRQKVASIAGRDAIDVNYRYAGMICFVNDIGDGTSQWQYLDIQDGGNLSDNTAWKPFGADEGCPSTEPVVVEGYGLLYNVRAQLDARGILPEGMSLLDSFSDCTDFFFPLDEDQLTSTRVQGVDDRPYWPSGLEGTDLLGFSAYAAGYRLANGNYSEFDGFARFLVCAIGEGTFDDRNYAKWNGANALTVGGVSLNEGLNIRGFTLVDPGPTVTDADGNVYDVIFIDPYYIMKQSLRTTKYNNGDSIPTGLDNSAWAATTDGAWSYPNGDSDLPVGDVIPPCIDLTPFVRSDGTVPFTEPQKGVEGAAPEDLATVAQLFTVEGTPSYAQMVNKDQDNLIDSDYKDDTTDLILDRVSFDLDEAKGYGNLYDADTANNALLPPTGWRMPTELEMAALLAYVGDDGVKLKGSKVADTFVTFNITADNHPAWPRQSTDPSSWAGTDDYQFNAYPAGYVSQANGGYPNGNGYAAFRYGTDKRIILTENGSIVNGDAGSNEGIGIRFVFDGLGEPPLDYLEDHDGNLYRWVKIAGRIWMAEDFVGTSLSDGTVITEVLLAADWLTEASPKYRAGYNGPTLTTTEERDLSAVPPEYMVFMGPGNRVRQMLTADFITRIKIAFDADTIDGIQGVDIVQSILGINPTLGDVSPTLDDLPDGVIRQIYTNSQAQDSGAKSGTAFPLVPNDYQRFFRTDIGKMFEYDTSRSKWLSVDTTTLYFTSTSNSATGTNHPCNPSNNTGLGISDTFTIVSLQGANQSADFEGVFKIVQGVGSGDIATVTAGSGDNGLKGDHTINADVDDPEILVGRIDVTADVCNRGTIILTLKMKAT